LIDFSRVTFQYPGAANPALQTIDWYAPSGSFTVVTGPSGSGKSTLARCINGLIPHFHGGKFGGTVTINGHDTRDYSTSNLSRHAGFVAQDPESQTVTDRVEDEIAFGLENLGLSRAEIRLRVEETLDLLRLSELRRRRIETLSGGERQRVVIAAAMAMRPSALVLDEPTSQLDPAGAEEVIAILERMNDELGTTIVLVEHRLNRVLGAADRLLILDSHGQLVADGTIQDSLGLLPSPPPLVCVARDLNWCPVPVTVRQARAFVQPSAELRNLETPERRSDNRPKTVELDRVSFRYDHEPVLRSITTAFHPGSVTALMGRNGSGKTTLLKLLNGLLKPSGGRVRVDGESIERRSTADLAQEIAYLPQNATAMLFNETIEAELQFTLRCRKRTGDTHAVLDQLGLAQLAQRNPLDLAGGEKMRAALAAVLVGEPRILLLDEPTRGVDCALKQTLGNLFRSLASQGMTVILATHDVDLVAEFADRMLLLGDGELVADGTPREIMPGSLTFAPQINRVFGGNLLTGEDVRSAFPNLRPDHS
jgi:energy-coupling factor transport system ATP-binding protein